MEKNGFRISIICLIPLFINTLRQGRTLGLAVESKGFGARKWERILSGFLHDAGRLDHSGSCVAVWRTGFCLFALVLTWAGRLFTTPNSEFWMMTEQPSAIIDIHDLSFQYPLGDSPSIRNINLQIHEGEYVLITGPTGSGQDFAGVMSETVSFPTWSKASYWDR